MSSPPVVAKAPSIDAGPRILSTQATLDGLTLMWLARPESGSTKVSFRFKRYGQAPELSACHELEVRIDGRELRYPLIARAQTQGTVVAEAAQATIDVDVVVSMQTAKQVELRLCSVQRTLNLAAAEAIGNFVDEFVMRAPRGVLSGSGTVTPPEETITEPARAATQSD